MAANLPVVELEGTPRQWGVQHGKAAKERIAANVELFSPLSSTCARQPFRW